MHAFALCLVLMGPLQDIRTEYSFKHASAALFVKQRWRDLEILVPGIQLAKSLQSPPPTGPWVYLDAKSNKLTFGSRDDVVEGMDRMMAEFDVKQKELTLSVLVARPEWKQQTSGTLKLANNETVTFGAESQGAVFQLRPRISNDGSVTVQLTVISHPEKERSTCMARISFKGTTFQVFGGQGYLVKEGKLEPFEKIHTPPTGDVWKPYKVEIRATILD